METISALTWTRAEREALPDGHWAKPRWAPTAKLKFVMRRDPGFFDSFPKPVLQQEWVDHAHMGYPPEWRDVPTEEQ
jgi:hypothetical protein